MPGADGSSPVMMFTWAERLSGAATVATQPRSIATSKPSRSTKKSRVSAGRSDLMLGTALLAMSHLRSARCQGSRQFNSKETEMQQNTRIAVAGATGRLGRPVVEILEARGYDVVPISRSLGVDVVTGDGLDDALAGVDTIIDCATG